jgi:hypothetical protein
MTGPVLERGLLVNFWEANPVGHVVEGLRHALGYHAADPSLPVSILLNSAAPHELAGMCGFLRHRYAVAAPPAPAGDPAGPLRGVPRRWEHVRDNPRRAYPPHRDAVPGFAAYYEASDRWFTATGSHGLIYDARPPAYLPHQSLRLELPAGARTAAGRAFAAAGADRAAGGDPAAGGDSGGGGGPPRVAVLPAGSGERWLYPSVPSWQLVLRGLRARLPTVRFVLVGKTVADGRTSTSFAAGELARVKAACGPRVVDLVDRPLAEQLAAVEACDVFVSPHTGFGMAVLCVGTPWLSLSGGRWPEFFFNGVPFHSVLPDPRRYPWLTQGADPPSRPDDDGSGIRTVSMTHRRFDEDLPEIVDAAAALIGRRWSYEECLAGYFPRLVAAHGGDAARIWSVDDIHRAYV